MADKPPDGESVGHDEVVAVRVGWLRPCQRPDRLRRELCPTLDFEHLFEREWVMAPAGTTTKAERRETLTEIRDTVAAEQAAATKRFVLATRWADDNLDPEQPDRAADRSDGCLYGCEAGGREHLEGDFNGGCVHGCAGDPDGFTDPFVPLVDWHAASSYAAAVGRTTSAGSFEIRDALLCRHRLPRTWAGVVAGRIPPAKARMIAQAIIGRPRDVSDHLDRHLAPIAHKIGRTVLDRKLDQALLELYPEQREQEQLDALDRRHVTLHEASINHTGIAEMSIRADWKDLTDLDRTLSRVAIAIAAQDQAAGRPADSLDVRRSRAVGILADPAAAHALLTGEHAPPPSKKAQLVLHVTADNLAGRDPVAYDATTGRTVLDAAVRDWCGRTDTHLQVLPVIDLDGHDMTRAYQLKSATALRAELIARTCVFPHCTKPARYCDKDHVVPYDHDDPDAGGPSCDCNIAPLCRHHHQLKTHAGWAYSVIDTGLWLWSDPYGQQFLRDRIGTYDVTPVAGCRRRE